MFRTIICCALAALPPLLAGCGGTSVSGEVTYEGQALDEGYITFAPSDGKGASAGGRIAGGRYAVKDIAPGPKKVKIEAVKKVPFARSSEDMARMAAEQKQKGNPTGLIDSADVVPADAVGNNSDAEIRSGAQVLDFHLKKPTRGK